MTVLHSTLQQIADFLGAMPAVFSASFASVISLAAFAGLACLVAGVPAIPAVVIGLCIGCGIVALLTAGVDRV